MPAFTRNRGVLRAMSALAVLASASGSRADDPERPGLNWVRLRGAEGCLAAPELAERVELRVGKMLFASVSDAGVFVDGYVGPARDGWDVVLAVSDREGVLLGRRELHVAGASCRVIDDAVTLVIAVTLYPGTALIDAGIALDPATSARLHALFGAEPLDPDPTMLAAVAPSEPSGAALAAPASARYRASDRVESEARGPAVERGFELGVDAVAIAALGQLPGLAAGAGLRVLVRPPEVFPFEIGGLLLPSAIENAGDIRGQARFALLLASLTACPIEPAWLPASAMCAGAEVGQLQVEASGFAEDNVSVDDVVANALLSALYRPEIVSGFHFRFAVALAVPLVQRSYAFEALDGTDTPLFRMPQIAGRIELGLALQL